MKKKTMRRRVRWPENPTRHLRGMDAAGGSRVEPCPALYRSYQKTGRQWPMATESPRVLSRRFVLAWRRHPSVSVAAHAKCEWTRSGAGIDMKGNTHPGRTRRRHRQPSY